MKPIDPSDMALHTWIAVLQASVHQVSPDILLTWFGYNNSGQPTLWGGWRTAHLYLIDVMDNQSMANVLALLYEKTIKTSNLILESIQESINILGYSTARALDRATHPILDCLVARKNGVLVGGRGITLRDSATALYRNAKPYFSAIQQTLEDFHAKGY